ncbi:Zinc finger, TAZ-type [Phytophthora cactorum]|nr:Zinc finger, TAZ-type [Phytophthora cactorum]
MNTSTPRVRFNWEDAVAHDRDLQRIDAFVKLTISKFPGQPAPRANAGRGSRYQPAPPAVKTELPARMVTTTPTSNGTTNGSSNSSGSTPQFINLRDYLSESSSEVDTREVNPMDELSDFEGDGPHQQPEPQQLEPHVEQEEQEEQEQSMDIAQALADDPGKSNLLLIHACNCDDVKCTDPEFHVFCPHMKRFLRSVCWASHSDKWRAYRLARITAELFAYHAMNCTVPQCNVPLCVKIREEEIV